MSARDSIVPLRRSSVRWPGLSKWVAKHRNQIATALLLTGCALALAARCFHLGAR